MASDALAGAASIDRRGIKGFLGYNTEVNGGKAATEVVELDL